MIVFFLTPFQALERAKMSCHVGAKINLLKTGAGCVIYPRRNQATFII